jgi:hypothetical protein
MRASYIFDYCIENWSGETMWRVSGTRIVKLLLGKDVMYANIRQTIVGPKRAETIQYTPKRAETSQYTPIYAKTIQYTPKRANIRQNEPIYAKTIQYTPKRSVRGTSLLLRRNSFGIPIYITTALPQLICYPNFSQYTQRQVYCKSFVLR